MLIKWKTGGYKQMIERVECTRETAKAVWVMEEPFQIGSKKPAVEVRHMKDVGYEKYHDTWDAAHAFLLDRAEDGLNRLKSQLQSAQVSYEAVKAMIKPEDA